MFRAITVSAFVASSGAASAQFFNNEADFLAQLDGPFLSEDFSGNTFGGDESFFSGNGFTASASAIDSPSDGDGLVSDPGLFNNAGFLSVNSPTDALVIEFSPNTTAVGGNFLSSDFDFLTNPFDFTVEFNDGSSQTISGSGFVGFVNLAGISSVTIDAPDDIFVTAFPAASSLIVGAAVPAPASALALVGLAAARRRR